MTAAVALPLLVLLVWYGPQPLFAGVVCGFALAALYEYFHLAFSPSLLPVLYGVLWGGVVMAGMAVHRLEVVGAGLGGGLLGGFMLVLGEQEDLAKGVARLGISLLGVVYVGFLFPHLIWLREGSEGARWVLFTLLVVMLGDSGGYVVGHRWGKRKLIPRVSPGKTVEGSFGALAGNLLGAGVAKAVLLPACSATGVFALAVFLGILGQIGDLCESALKRAFGTKEAGWFIPGHGGVLDRTDSLIFPVAFMYYYLALWT